MQINILNDRLRFPDPLLANAEGLVAIGGDLSKGPDDRIFESPSLEKLLVQLGA